MSFVIVEFEDTDGGGLGIVRQSWITPRKKEVFWPPYKQTQLYTKALKQDEPVNYNTWTCCKIKRFFYETDDFAMASSKLRQAEYTSDLQSDVEDSQSRRKRKPNKFIDSSSEEEDTNTNKENKETIINISPELPITRSEPSLTVTLRSEPLLRTKFTHFKPVRNKKKQETIVQLPDNLFPSLPISSDVDLQIFEEKLKENKENLTILIHHLERLGGKDIVTKTNRTLRYTVSDELLTNYNYHGQRNNKKPFNELFLNSAIIDSVKSTTPSATTRQIEDVIKVWLKHAPQRVKRTLRRKHN